MKRFSDRQLKVALYVICAIGIIVGFLLWRLLPDVFPNNALIHVGNGEYGFKYGALILLPLQLLALIPKDNSIDEEIHTDDFVEREIVAKEISRKILESQVVRAIVLAVVICGVMGLSILIL